MFGSSVGSLRNRDAGSCQVHLWCVKCRLFDHTQPRWVVPAPCHRPLHRWRGGKRRWTSSASQAARGANTPKLLGLTRPSRHLRTPTRKNLSRSHDSETQSRARWAARRSPTVRPAKTPRAAGTTSTSIIIINIINISAHFNISIHIITSIGTTDSFSSALASV